jgi:hypothetical protein
MKTSIIAKKLTNVSTEAKPQKFYAQSLLLLRTRQYVAMILLKSPTHGLGYAHENIRFKRKAMAALETMT